MDAKNANGTPLRCRKNGSVQTWKTRPGVFKMPVKHGMKLCFYITNAPDGVKGQASPNHDQWCTVDKWPAEHVLFEGVEAPPILSGAALRFAQLELAKRAFAQDPTPALAATIRQLEKGHA